MMTEESYEKYPKRKSNRLKNFDYSSHGAYFVTICTDQRESALGTILENGIAMLSGQGKTAECLICEIHEKYPSVSVEKYVVMPNHIHLLIMIDRQDGTGNPSPTLGNIVGWYKYQVTKRLNSENATPGKRIFQRSYHDHIIRSEAQYQRIWNYIDGNPMRWKEDCFYTE